MIAFSSYAAFVSRLALGIVLLTAALMYVDFTDLREALSRINSVTLLVATLVSAIGTIVLPALVTKRTLAVGEIQLSWWELIKINFAMRFYVLTLPHAITVGMRWHRYNQGQGKGWEIAALLLFERVIQLISVVSLAFVFLSISYPTLPSNFQMLVPISAGLCVWGLILFFGFVSKRFFLLVDPAITFFSRPLPSALGRRVARLRTAVVDYQSLGSHGIGFVVFCTFSWHLSLIISGYAVSNGLDAGLGFADIGWMRSAIFLLTLLPITVGGIGVREVGFAFLFELYGVGYSTGLAFGLVLLSIQLILGLVGLILEAFRVTTKFWRHRRV